MKVTVELLEEKKACEWQVLLFQSLFPDGVEVTEKECLKYWNKFDWNWAARNLLSPDSYEEYRGMTAPAREKYNQIERPAWEEYKDMGSTEAGWEEYKKIETPAGEELVKTLASAFSKLASKQ